MSLPFGEQSTTIGSEGKSEMLRRGGRWRPAAAAAIALFVCAGAAVAKRDRAAPVVVADMRMAITPPARDYFARAMARAEAEGAACLLIEMDTPGGDTESMRKIASAILGSPIPVVVWVSPAGARAASAGAVIALAANVLAMAPGTNIGAAHPVTGGGGDIPGDMRGKVVNDMAAFARAVAARRERSAQWAEAIVRKSVASTDEEALRLGVADLVAGSRRELLRALDGRTVRTARGEVVLHTASAPVEEMPLSPIESLLLVLFTPNAALILGAVAFYGIVAEVQNPGAIVPGVAGSIALVLSLYSLSVLSVNATGVALLLLAGVLFVVDVYAPTHGVLTVGGVAAFVFGAMMLFRDTGTGMQVSLGVVLGLALTTAAFSVFVVGSAWRSRLSPPGSGPETLIGATAEARTDVATSGKVFAAGAFWSAVNVGADPIVAGDAVLVEGRTGLTLRVRRAAPAAAGPVYERPERPA